MPKHCCILIGFFLIITIFMPVTPCRAEEEMAATCQEFDRRLSASSPLMHGEDVSTLQKELIYLKYYRGPVNGKYDTLTQKAIKRFQKDYKLKANGIVDWETWHALALEVEKPLRKTEEAPQPPSGTISIIVDTTTRTLTLYSDDEPYQQYDIACGKPSTPSPVGVWKVARKAENWGTGFGSRWLGLNVSWGIFGIHGTNKPFSIGSYASHGCIRMHNSSVEQLYPWVPTETPVYVVGNPFGVTGHWHEQLVRGDRGADVSEVQRTLQNLGYYQDEVDGVFDFSLEEAVITYRKENGLPFDNRVDDKMYIKLGL